MFVVYVAGRSSELDRAKRACQLVKRSPVLELADDWPPEFHTSPLRPLEKRTISSRQLLAIRRSDAFWLLDGPEGGPTDSHVEFGVALSMGIPVVASGQPRDRSVFSELADLRFEIDANAFTWIERTARLFTGFKVGSRVEETLGLASSARLVRQGLLLRGHYAKAAEWDRLSQSLLHRSMTMSVPS